MNLEKHILTYLNYCEYQRKLNPKTIKAYKIDLFQFAASTDISTDATSKSILCDYIVKLHAQFKPRTVKRKSASIRAFYRYLEYEDIISQNPCNKCNFKFQSPSLLPRTIPIEHVKNILFSSYNASKQTRLTENGYISILKDIAVLELLFATGVRVSELCSLKSKDIDLHQGTIKIYGKGSKERLLQIVNSDVITALEKYKRTTPNSTEFFFVNRYGKRLSEQSVRQIINKYAKQANIQIHITPHMFRHTFATLLLEENVDIRYIQQILGHSSILTTQIYTHVSSHKQRSIFLNNHPRNKFHMQ